MTIDFERVGPRNRKILFHSLHGIPGISNQKIWLNGKRPKFTTKFWYVQSGDGVKKPILQLKEDPVRLTDFYSLFSTGKNFDST